MNNLFPMSSISFHFNINLKNFSAIALATYLWKLPAMQKVILSYDNMKKLGKKEKYRYKLLYVSMEPIWVYLKSTPYYLTLPSSLSAFLDDAVVSMGENIFNWIEYLIEILKLDISFASDIYFTQFGIVDVNKIFNFCWARKLNLNRVCITNYLIFVLSCIFAQVDFINMYKYEMIEYDFCISGRKLFETRKDNVDVLIVMWLFHYISKEKGLDLPPNLRLILGQKINLEDYADYSVKMFKLCAALGFNYAANYFLNFICTSDILPLDRLNTVLKCSAELSIEKIQSSVVTFYEKEKHLEVLLNLLNDFAVSGRGSFILQQGVQFLLLLLQFPFHQFYLPTLEFLLNYTTVSVVDFKMLIVEVVNNIVDDSESCCPIKKYNYKILLMATWCRMNVETREFVLLNSNILSSLFKVKNYSCLAALLNIKYLSKKIDFSKLDLYASIEKYVRQNFFNSLHKFLEFFSIDEQEILKLKLLSCFEIFFYEDRYDKAERFLDLLVSSRINPRSFYKSKIDHKKVIRRFLVSQRYDLVNKFLLWSFPTEEQRLKIKAEMGILDDGSTYQIFGPESRLVVIKSAGKECNPNIKI